MSGVGGSLSDLTSLCDSDQTFGTAPEHDLSSRLYPTRLISSPY